MSRLFINLPISFLITFTSILFTGLLVQPAFSQRDYDPNLGHFYMGRQQWTVEDNSPVIQDKTGTAPGAMNGGLMNRATPLPKAGWQGYAPIDNPPKTSSPSSGSGHSSSKNKTGHAGTGYKGKAGNLSKGSSPSGIQGYKPYATYSTPAATPNPGNAQQTSTHVKGNLLHWRHSPNQQ